MKKYLKLKDLISPKLEEIDKKLKKNSRLFKIHSKL